MADNVFTLFPGCSLATTAKENYASLTHLIKTLGITLVELEDWNCCGSSSAHSIDRDLADQLAMRNLSLAPPDRPLLVACPSCHLHLQHALLKLRNRESSRRRYRTLFGREAPVDLKIIHLFELLDQVDWKRHQHRLHGRLNGLRFAPYYGCMLERPPSMKHPGNYYGIMEHILTGLGAQQRQWGYASQCCGTFLSVVRPDMVSIMVQKIVADASRSGADCIVTACAMCHLNLEVRSAPNERLPIFHFTEILSVALGHADPDAYFQRHLIDPRPLLVERRVIGS